MNIFDKYYDHIHHGIYPLTKLDKETLQHVIRLSGFINYSRARIIAMLIMCMAIFMLITDAIACMTTSPAHDRYMDLWFDAILLIISATFSLILHWRPARKPDQADRASHWIVFSYLSIGMIWCGANSGIDIASGGSAFPLLLGAFTTASVFFMRARALLAIFGYAVAGAIATTVAIRPDALMNIDLIQTNLALFALAFITSRISLNSLVRNVIFQESVARAESARKTETAQRKQVQIDLQNAYTQLEQRVAERTEQLQQANDNLILEIQERRRAEMINQVLLGISNAVNTAERLEQLFPYIHRWLNKLIAAPNFYIALLDTQNKQITFPYYSDRHDTMENISYGFDPAKSLTGLVTSSGESQFLKMDQLAEMHAKGRIVGTKPKVWIGIPLKIKNQIIGVMAVQSYKNENKFSQEDVRVLELISEQVAHAIEKKRANDHLSNSEARYRQLTENAPIGIFSATRSGHLIEINSRLIDILGFASRADALKTRIFSDPPLANPIFAKQCQGCIQNGRPVTAENRITSLNGQTLFLRYQLAPSRNHGGDIIGFQGIIEDITDKWNLEQQLQQAQKLESIGTLAGGIAHDFNNILFPIIGYTEMVSDELPEGSTARRNLMEVINQANRAKDLIRQILAFSRQTDEDVGPILIQPILKESIKLLQSSVPSGIEMTVDIDQDCGPVIGNPTQILQIITNLCTNAYQSIDPPQGRLTIKLTQHLKNDSDPLPPVVAPPCLHLSVADTGSGMAPDVIDRIFDPYFTTKPLGKGSGMGLAVVHGIIKAINGHIQVDSRPGNGSTFHIYLPLLTNSESSDGSVVSDSPDPKGREHILLVDDEESIVELQEQMLTRLGYRVTTMTQSKHALDAFAAHATEFDLVITDMSMPGMPGDQLASAIANIRADIPIIMSSGYSDITLADIDTSNIRAYLHKPVSLHQLSQTIREILDQ